MCGLIQRKQNLTGLLSVCSTRTNHPCQSYNNWEIKIYSATIRDESVWYSHSRSVAISLIKEKLQKPEFVSIYAQRRQQMACPLSGCAAALPSSGNVISLGPSRSYPSHRTHNIKRLSRGSRILRLSCYGKILNDRCGRGCAYVKATKANQSRVSADAAENADMNDYPMMRTFENDSCRLIMIGDNDDKEAIVAAAADGGLTAAEHVASRRPFMVIETFYPGRSSSHSTIATRLHVPSNKVLEKAKQMQLAMGLDMPNANTSRQALGIAFHRVVLQRMWNFELTFFKSGSCRDMNDLQSARKADVFGSIMASDERLLSALAEVMCSYAISSVKNEFRQRSFGIPLFNSFKKKQITSSNNDISIYLLSQSEVASFVKANMGNGGMYHIRKNQKEIKDSQWWSRPLVLSNSTDNYGESNGWNVHTPIYKLQVDSRKFQDVMFQGWQKCKNDVWEILLSHQQMVKLADVLDMYFEDPNSCQGKQFHTDSIINKPMPAINKMVISVWQMLFKGVAGGVALGFLIILSRIWNSRLLKSDQFASSIFNVSSNVESATEYHTNQTKKPLLPCNKQLSSKELEVICALVVQKVKDSLALSYDIQRNDGRGAWLGVDLTNWGRSEKMVQENAIAESRPSFSTDSDVASSMKDSFSNNLQGGNQKSLNIAVYELTVSRNGVILGFQPINRAAVNRWAGHPLAKALYHKKKLLPGFLEPGLMFKGPPKDPVVIELLMSEDSDNYSVTARPSYT